MVCNKPGWWNEFSISFLFSSGYGIRKPGFVRWYQNLADVKSICTVWIKELYERKKEAVNNWRNIVEEIEASLLKKMSLFGGLCDL